MNPIPLTPLPQIVPSQVCLRCDVCCRFPEPDSFLRPYFTAEEVREAVSHGIDGRHFPSPHGGQVHVVPNPVGEGYLCPAFDPTTAHCRIYDVRPLDCQLYPFAVMWNPDRTGVVLGWDSKCPFMNEAFPSPHPSPHVGRGEGEGMKTYAERIARLVERDEIMDVFLKHPSLIGRFQEDVMIVSTLPRLSERLIPGRSPLKPLGPDDRARFANALAASDSALAVYHLAPHLIWRSLFSYRWTEFSGHLCLFAENQDGIFMSLPPLPLTPTLSPEGRGEGKGTRHASRVTCHVVETCLALMRERNHGSSVTRIEGIPEELKSRLESLEYRLVATDRDYLYRTSDVAGLKGDRYKSQRAACNRFMRSRDFRYEPYREEHREACLKLFADWAAQQASRPLEEPARHMLRDCESAHMEAFISYEALGLVGRVVWVDGSIRAYTFGYERSASIFCVLHEVADRRISGLAQFVFREFCREAAQRGYAFVNTMEDSGVPTLARSKAAYRPCQRVPSYIALEK